MHPYQKTGKKKDGVTENLFIYIQYKEETYVQIIKAQILFVIAVLVGSVYTLYDGQAGKV